MNTTELHEFTFDEKNEENEEILRERVETIKNDNRPQISTDFNRQHNNILHKKEEDSIIKKIKKKEIEIEKNKKTIMDMQLKDIINKTTETTANFWEDYKIKLVESKHNYNNKYNLDEENTNISSFLMIHILAFTEYMKENNNILYIGIFIIIISIIIYIFNITS
mgnify:FL=1|tara:strand:+ start:24 stop:518 length:495 start_codon:yes stop_codon:yes gene_type:complete